MDSRGSELRPCNRRSAFKSPETLNGKLADVKASVETESRIGRTRRTRSAKERPVFNTRLLRNRSPPIERSLDARLEAPCLPTSTTQKRPSAADSDITAHRLELKRARLTRKNLALLNNVSRSGAASVSDSPISDNADSAKTISTSSSSLVFKAGENGILLASSDPPANLDGIRSRCLRRRGSIPPTEACFQRYQDRVILAGNESAVSHELHWLLLKQYDEEKEENEGQDADDFDGDNDNDDEEEEEEEEEEEQEVVVVNRHANIRTRRPYTTAYNQSLTGFPTDAGLNEGLSVLKPDFIEGLHKWQFHPSPIHTIRGALLFPDKEFSIALPHFAGEWKGIGKNMHQARVQSAVDGAALVFARTEALKHLGKSDPSRHAKVITFTMDGSTLSLFAHYACSTREGKLEYHQYLIASKNLVESYDAFEVGRGMLRNAQDYAKRQSEILRNRLRKHAKRHDYRERRRASVAALSRLRKGRPPKQGATSLNDPRPVRQDRAAAVPKRKRGRPPKRAK